MWIVRLALSRPYTFIVMALVVILLTPVVLLRTPTDIFPDINIPVISLIWNFTGLEPQEMEQRITSNSERAVTTLVNDVEHIESQSLNGISVVRFIFSPAPTFRRRWRRPPPSCRRFCELCRRARRLPSWPFIPHRPCR